MFNEDKPAKLIVSRRAIAAGIAGLLGGVVPAEAIQRLTNIPLTVSPNDFADFMGDGLVVPKHSCPMTRLLFEGGDSTLWMVYSGWAGRGRPRKGSHNYDQCIAMEVAIPGPLGTPVYHQFKLG